MKHLMYLAIGLAIIVLANALVYGILILTNLYGIFALVVPVTIALSYAIGRGLYESLELNK